jgi:hypothetical protein
MLIRLFHKLKTMDWIGCGVLPETVDVTLKKKTVDVYLGASVEVLACWEDLTLVEDLLVDRAVIVSDYKTVIDDKTI